MLNMVLGLYKEYMVIFEGLQLDFAGIKRTFDPITF